MYFEIYKNGTMVKRGREILNTLSWSWELMDVPSLDMTLPIEYLEYFDGREEVKIYVNGKVFWGIVWDIELDKNEETIGLSLRHVVSEWEYRQISVNHAMSDTALNIVYKGSEVEKSTENDEAITASDFSVLEKQYKKMKDADFIEKAYAAAWKISDGDKVPITTVKKEKDGDDRYKVTFKTAKGTEITITCNIIGTIEYQTERTVSNRGNNETIAGTPFSVSYEKALTMSSDDIIKAAKLHAYVYRHKSDEVAVTYKATDFEKHVGTYTVTGRTAKGTEIIIKVKVTDQDSYSSVDDPAVIDKLEDIYANKEFAYPGWQIDMEDSAKTEMIDYVYSRQNKLEALTQTMELTEDLFWRVGFTNEKIIEIGKFGQKKHYSLSLKPSGERNIRIISEPTVDYDFDNVINVATVYSDKSDSGMSSVTLRDIYNDKSLQKAKFPVIILHGGVNNERDYSRYIKQIPAIAPNNELEYAVIDEESIALESGKLIEGTFSFNDLSPFEIDGKRIKDAKRLKAAKVVYARAIRELKHARRSYNITLTTEEIPADLMVGDRVILMYTNRIWNMEACSNYYKKILSYDDWYYVTRIDYEIDVNGGETNELTLSKWIKVERETRYD